MRREKKMLTFYNFLSIWEKQNANNKSYVKYSIKIFLFILALGNQIMSLQIIPFIDA